MARLIPTQNETTLIYKVYESKGSELEFMYVCIEVALRGSAHGIGRPTRPGPIKKVGPMSEPGGTIATASRTLSHTHALNVRFLKQLYPRQLRVSWVLM